MKKSASLCSMALVIMVSAIYLPMLYKKIFFKEIGKTHLFYSPVSRDFILKEKFSAVPREAVKTSLDHHTGIAYKKADNTYVSRMDFEKHLPFIFYKNMEMWGLLPLTFDNETFDKQAIKKNRRVLELKSRQIFGNHPVTPLWPLLESNPGRARLVFPEDRFAMTHDAMEFINADTNKKDTALTKLFTKALRQKGFVFPAQSVNGKFTVLKPFDEGVFLVDANFNVFHVKRVNGNPMVIKTPIDPALKTRHIKVSENKLKKYFGLLLTCDGQINLLTCDNYTLIALPLKAYSPDTMDLKLIFNPLFTTAVYSNETMIWALAMDKNFVPIDRFSHPMSRGDAYFAKKAFHMLFPFALNFDTLNKGFVDLRFQGSGKACLPGLATCLVFFLCQNLLVKKKRPGFWNTALVGTLGIYGLIAVHMADLDVHEQKPINQTP
jgi:Domain of unknown function (DUF4857)